MALLHYFCISVVVQQTTFSNPKIPGDVTTEQNLKDFWGDQISFQMHFIKNGRKSVEIGFCALFPRARVRESHFFVVQSEGPSLPQLLGSHKFFHKPQKVETTFCYCCRGSWGEEGGE